MTDKPTIWQSDSSKQLFHDGCFEADETRDGFTQVEFDKLEDDDECSSCGGNFVLEQSDEEEEDETDEEEDEE